MTYYAVWILPGQKPTKPITLSTHVNIQNWGAETHPHIFIYEEEK